MVGIRARAAAAALLMAVSLSACDGSGPPNDADLDDFCDAYYRLFSGDMAEVDPRDSEQEQAAAMVEALRAWAKKLELVGTPDDLSDQARKGFELIVRAAADLQPGDVDNLAQLGEDFSEVEMAATEAFEDYATQHCESPFGDPPTAKRRP
jgi:hypothetical protein